MDMLQYLKTMRRICNSQSTCTDDCPFSNGQDCYLNSKIPAEYEANILKTMASNVEKWLEKNPCKTYKDDFLAKFPNGDRTEMILDMNRTICRYQYYGKPHEGTCIENCDICWNEEYTEEQNDD